MRAALALVVAALLTGAACRTVTANHALRGSVDLGKAGHASGIVHAREGEHVEFALENRGPGELSFEVLDAAGNTLESGALARSRRNFSWRPLDSFVRLVVRAPQRATRVDYMVASPAPFTVEWNLTAALGPLE